MTINKKEVEDKLIKRLLENDSSLQGSITLNFTASKKSSKNQGEILINHSLYSPHNVDYMGEIMGYLNEEFSNYGYSFVTPNKGLKVNAIDLTSKKPINAKKRTAKEVSPDAVEVLYFGTAPIDSLTIEENYKKINPNPLNKISNIIEVLEFITPIIVDENWNVIDGVIRLKIAQKLNITEVPIMVVKVDEIKKDFLRIALNRTSEFQKWYYNDTKDSSGTHKGLDNFVDDNPQLQPLLEPIGVFGERILPVSFFNQSILRYRVESYNIAANSYKQEIGLAKWAELQSKRILEAEARQKELNKGYVKDKSELVSLFDLIPTDEDFLPTHDIVKEREGFIKDTKKAAAALTRKADKAAKARKEKLGQEWQSTRLTPSEKKEQRRIAELEKLEKVKLEAAKKQELDNPILNDDAEATTPEDPTSVVKSQLPIELEEAVKEDSKSDEDGEK